MQPPSFFSQISTFLPLLLILSLPVSNSVAIPPPPNGAPTIVSREILMGQRIQDSYIVVMKAGASESLFQSLTSSARGDGTLQKQFRIGKNFRAYEQIIPQEKLDAMRASPEIAYISPNRVVTSAATFNQSAPWNLGRISHRDVGPNFNYIYEGGNNCSTQAFILDTGIYTAHSEFQGRATFGTNTIGGDNGDGTGHGTHVAGILGGRNFGVARETHLVAVKVLDSAGFGTYASVIEGIQWAVVQATVEGRKGESVINMSLIGDFDQALNDAARSAVENGIPVVVAAGNYGENAIKFSPASEREVLTIGATNIQDIRAPWSNFGTKLDHFAPGVNILSAYNTGPNSTAIISGTSMAAPHVAGLVNYVQCEFGIKHPRIIREKLEELATKGVVVDAGGSSPNRIVYNGSGF